MFSSGQLLGRPRVLSRYAACMEGKGEGQERKGEREGNGREREWRREERKREQGKMKKDVLMTSCSKLGDHCFNLEIMWTITL